MKVASSPEEWKSRGEKLYYESNYEMAMMCFERARDSYWEKKSKAAGLRETAKHLQDSKPENANEIFREAAGIFESIGMTESAAQCFSDLGDYEQAGKLYIVKGKEPDLKRAGDCFYLAGSYEMAFEAYTRGNFFSECLKVCAKRGTYEAGLRTLQEWKKNEGGDRDWVNIEQNFRENCARSYFDRKDIKSMGKCIEDFHSTDFKRDFLKSLGLPDEFLELEKKSCNCEEAIISAKMLGDILSEADLHEKMGRSYGAYQLVIAYVLSNSLWSGGSNGWPLKPFAQKAELLKKAITFSKTSHMSQLAQLEADILLDEKVRSTELMDQLKCCQNYMTIRGEMLCWWKLLDLHLKSNSRKYVWPIVAGSPKVESMIRNNELSVLTLRDCWAYWKQMIINMLQRLPDGEIKVNDSHVEFALNYFGVEVNKHCHNPAHRYILLVPDANWVKSLEDEFLEKKGRLVYVNNVKPLLSFAKKYWNSKLLSVGMCVLHVLDALYKPSILSKYWQTETLMEIYDVSVFLRELKFEHAYKDLRTLENYVKMSTDSLAGLGKQEGVDF